MLRHQACIAEVHGSADAGKLLWVDDSRPLLGLYKTIFEGLGFQVQSASCPQEALDCLDSHDADMAILDYEMPEMNGCMLASLMKSRRPELPVILYSSSVSIPEHADRWVDAVCSKAVPREVLLEIIESTLAQRNALPSSERLLHGCFTPRPEFAAEIRRELRRVI